MSGFLSFSKYMSLIKSELTMAGYWFYSFLHFLAQDEDGVYKNGTRWYMVKEQEAYLKPTRVANQNAGFPSCCRQAQSGI